MSLLQNVLFAHRCTSTHQKLVLDALRHLRRDDAESWRRVFLKHGESLLAGANAPDDQFKDFRNHVVHVREKCWGGAVESVDTWYRHTVEALQGKQWAKAAFAAGALSHYYADPLMPLHTAQTEEAGIVHRACDRSVFRSYDVLTAILERDLGGYPEIKVPTGPRWLAEMNRTLAIMSKHPAIAPNPTPVPSIASGARSTSTAIVVVVNEPMREIAASHTGDPVA